MNAVDLEKKESSFSGSNSEEFQYKAISKAAITSVVLAILSFTAFVLPILVSVPLLAVCFGFLAMTNIRRYPEELIGRNAAVFGVIVGLMCLVGSIGMHAYIYATEVPEGYQRISFYELKPNKKNTPSPASKDFDGKKVFLKGYVRPSTRKKNLKEFILVGDFGSCCFGGNPEITDVVSISIQTDQTVDYSLRTRRITGEFRLNPQTKQTQESEVPKVFYEILADKVR